MPTPSQFVSATTQELKIIKGIGKSIGDTNSAEQDPVVLSLMALSGEMGFSVDPLHPFFPQMPSHKGDGVYADSSVVDGKTLIAAARDNVKETINLVLVHSTWALLGTQLAALNRLAEDAENFWETNWQIEPIYLKWWCNGAPGPQYALIYKIDVATSQLDYPDNPMPALSVTLQMEREVAWRAIPPGANPKLWTMEFRGQNPGSGYTYSQLHLTGLTNDLFQASIQNRFEWNALNYTANLSKNYIDIPGASIPGDAPALVQMRLRSLTGSSFFPARIHYGRSTKPISIGTRDAGSFSRASILNVGDNNGIATKTLDASCGVISNASNSNKYIGTYTIGVSATVASILHWVNSVGAFADLLTLRGTYVAFLRCKQTNGASGDVQIRLSINDGLGVNILTLDYVNVPFFATAAVGCVSRFGLAYLGRFVLPLSGLPPVSVDGRGLAIENKTLGLNTVMFDIDGRNSVASTRNLEFLDLILIPIDEATGAMINNAAVSTAGDIWTLDNTGYSTHGKPGNIFRAHADDLVYQSQMNMEVQGQSLTLIPNITNRIDFIMSKYNSGGEICSAPDSTTNDLEIFINIVPRWYGVRDK